MLQSGHGRRDGRTDGRTDGWTDGRTDGVKPIYPPTTSLFVGYNNVLLRVWCQAIIWINAGLLVTGPLGTNFSQHLKSPRSLSSTFAHPIMVTLVNIMVMNGWLTSFSFHVNRPSHFYDKLISDSRSRSWARSHSGPSILLICFLFISHQSDQQFLRYTYFKIWLWNIQGQGHEWGQRSRSHIIHTIQLMHFLFISYESDQPFLRCGHNSVWPWKKHNNSFSCFVVIGWVVLTLSCRQANFC